MRRRFQSAVLSLCIASLSTSAGRAQALADKVPGDAIFYVGWAGSEAVTAASKETRLAAVLAESRGHELFGSYFDAIEAKLVAKEPNAREPMRLLRAIGGPAWRKPTAMFVATAASTQGAAEPRFAILTQAGVDAEKVAADLKAVIGHAPASRMKFDVASIGDIVCYSVNFASAADAVAKSGALSADSNFAAAAKRVTPNPALLWYVNVEGAVAAGERSLAEAAPDKWKQVATFLDASGLRGAKRYVSASGFDGRDWTTQTFLDAPAPRAGFLSTVAGPIDPALLKVVPADATFFTSARIDFAQSVRDTQAALGKTSEAGLKNFNMALGAIHQAIGTSPIANVLDPLGHDWVAFNSPTVNSAGLPGIVVVNKPDDPVKLKKALATASRNLANWINIAISRAESDRRAPTMAVQGAQTKIGDVEVNYLALPIVAPSWAVHNGRLYLGLFPQSVGAAARRAGPSLVDSEKYKAAIARLGVATPGATSFSDLPDVAGTGSSYTNLLLVARYAGFADLFGTTLPEPLLPPMDTLMANLAPAASVTWSDDAGFHSKSIVPFPGATLLSEQGAMTLGAGGVAGGVSVLLPSLNRARVTANRVKSASNLAQIGQGMLLYANEHGGRYPADFAELIKSEPLEPSAMINPNATTTIPVGLAGDAAGAWAAANADYVYLGRGQTSDAPADAVLAHERLEDNEGEGMNVLFGDGHVEWLASEAAKAAIERTAAGRPQL